MYVLLSYVDGTRRKGMHSTIALETVHRFIHIDHHVSSALPKLPPILYVIPPRTSQFIALKSQQNVEG